MTSFTFVTAVWPWRDRHKRRQEETADKDDRDHEGKSDKRLHGRLPRLGPFAVPEKRSYSYHRAGGFAARAELGRVLINARRNVRLRR